MTTPDIRLVLDKLRGVKEVKGGYLAHCPVHEDKKQSLSITEKDNKILLYCHAGCTVEEIISAIGLEMKDLFPEKEWDNNSKRKPKMQLIATYDYQNREGKLLFQKLRFQLEDGSKTFRQRKPKKNGGFSWSLKGITPIPYKLPEVLAATENKQPIFVVEGEKDVEALIKLGLTATCNFDGASKNKQKPKWRASYNKYFAGANVVIIPDNDGPGIAHATNIAHNLKNIAKSVKLLHLPGLDEKQDTSDWLQKGGTKNELLKLVENAEEWEPKPIEEKPDEQSAPIESSKYGVFEEDGCYCKTVYKGQSFYSEKITNFTIEIKSVVTSPRFTEIVGIFTNENGEVMEKEFKPEAFDSIKQFRSMIANPYFTYTGTDKDLQNIKNHIFSFEHDRKTGVEQIGFHLVNNKWVFVASDKAINSKSKEIRDIEMVDWCKEINTNIIDTKPITKEELQELSLHLFKFNTLKKTSVILGHVAAIFLKEKLSMLNVKFNHLLLIGQAGSGKSQTAESIIMPILGLTESPIPAAGCTPFTSAKTLASSNTMPMIIDELKPMKIGKKRLRDLSNMLRSSYDGHTDKRGTPTQKINKYEYKAPVILLGEARIEEAAITERSLELSFAKQDIQDQEIRDHFKFLYENRHLLNKLGRSLLDESFNIGLDYIKKEREQLVNQVTEEIKTPRIINSVVNCLLGIDLLMKVYESLGLKFNITGINPHEIIKAINTATFEDLLNSGQESKSIVDETLEIFDRMANSDTIGAGIHYKIVNGYELAIDVKSIYDDFTKYVATHHIEGEFLPYRQFTKQLRTETYYSDYKTVKFYKDWAKNSNKRSKAFILNINKLLEKNIEVESLLEDYQETFSESDNLHVVK